MVRKALGKGIGALIPDAEIIENIRLIDIEKIERNPFQPREDIEKDLEPLVNSIKNQGVLEPILVKKRGENYILIAGERRLVAAKQAGLKKIPARVLEVSDATMAEITLVENLLREDLNPIEEATGYKTLIEKFGYTHEKIGEIVGRDRATITNKLRLLKLSPYVQELLKANKIQEGHAKLLIPLSEEEQKMIADAIVEKGLSVRDTERLIKRLKESGKSRRRINEFKIDSLYLGREVVLRMGKRGRGEIVIKFKNREELEHISKTLGLNMEGI